MHNEGFYSEINMSFWLMNLPQSRRGLGKILAALSVLFGAVAVVSYALFREQFDSYSMDFGMKILAISLCAISVANTVWTLYLSKNYIRLFSLTFLNDGISLIVSGLSMQCLFTSLIFGENKNPLPSIMLSVVLQTVLICFSLTLMRKNANRNDNTECISIKPAFVSGASILCGITIVDMLLSDFAIASACMIIIGIFNVFGILQFALYYYAKRDRIDEYVIAEEIRRKNKPVKRKYRQKHLQK